MYFSGSYTPELASLYAASASVALQERNYNPRTYPDGKLVPPKAFNGKRGYTFTDLARMSRRGLERTTYPAGQLNRATAQSENWDSLTVRSAGIGIPPRQCGEYLLKGDGSCTDLIGEDHIDVSPFYGVHQATLKGSLKPVDQRHKVDPSKQPDPVMAESHATEKKNRELEEVHLKAMEEATKYWKRMAEKKDWDCVRADMSVYRYSNLKVKEDPRRSKEYKEKVLKDLGFAEGMKRGGLTEDDMRAIREVIWRKAAAFWIEGEPRTTVRHLLHDTIPTGPPVRTPPHKLKGEEADWVDAQLQAEVLSG